MAKKKAKKKVKKKPKAKAKRKKAKKKVKKKPKPSRQAVMAAKRREIDDELKKLSGKLNPRHRRFAEIFVREPDCFGNGVQAYAKAYNINLMLPGAYETCMAAASRLLRFVKVCDYIRSLLDAESLTDANADRNLAFVMNQFEDLPSKVRAIGQYNKLRGRITEKHKLSGKVTHVVNRIMFGEPQK
jgi:hypothetical protein